MIRSRENNVANNLNGLGSPYKHHELHITQCENGLGSPYKHQLLEVLNPKISLLYITV